jgi:hypothetical protein
MWRRGAQVSWLSLKTKVDGLWVVWPQNHSDGFSSVCEWFDLKTTRTVFTDLASKSVATVSGGLTSKPAATISDGLASKTDAMVFSGLASKSVAAVCSNLALKLVVTYFHSNNQMREGERWRLWLYESCLIFMKKTVFGSCVALGNFLFIPSLDLSDF